MTRELPYLLLNKEKSLENIQRMIQKAQRNNLRLRPHFKTHQSVEIGNWFKQAGVKACTVSSFQMAEYFAKNGWDDITVAFPISIQDFEIANQLANDIKLNIIFSSYKNLASFNRSIDHAVGVYIELDCGYNRTGISPNNTREIALMVNQISQNEQYHFKGFLTHLGQTYNAKSTKEVEALHRKTLTLLTQLKSFWKESFPEIEISYGDTPSCSISDDFWGIDEIRPGNFVFYDIMQTQIGSCSIDDIAIALICPVVDIYPERGEAVIRGGAIHLSKDFITFSDGFKSYGAVGRFDGKNWGNLYEGLYIKSLSQEHGIIASKDIDQINALKVGQLVAILPIHSCLTVDCMGEVFLEDGSSIETMRKHCK